MTTSHTVTVDETTNVITITAPGPQGATGVVEGDAPVTYDVATKTVGLDYGEGLALSGGALVADFGTAAGEVAEGDHDHDADYEPAGTAAAQVATHSADTTAVHGIADTANLVLTSDARLSDARTPTAHKATHATGGTDALSAADIGAATSAHTHTGTYEPAGTVASHAGATDPHGDRAYADTYFVPLTAVGSSVASLSGGKVPSDQLPAIAITATHVVASQAAMLALTAQAGDVAVRTDLSKSFILAGSDATVLGDWQELLTPADTVTSVDGRTGTVTLSDLYAGSAHAHAYDASGTAAAQIAAHEGAADPHPGYLTLAEGTAAFSDLGHDHDADYSDLGHDHDADYDAAGTAASQVAAHEAAADPHPGYLTLAEGTAQFSATSHAHTGVYEASGAVASHEADTTAVHGIADTSALVLTSDSRLTDARTPTAHKTSHATGGSDALAASDIGAVPTSRTLTATSPVTIDGTTSADLSANRTIAINDGSTSAKGAVQLEDSTSSTSTTKAATPNSVKTAYDLANGAVAKSVVDAKGDLLVGTASDTVGRLAVGSTDGQVLKVKASASTGLEWGSVSSEQLIATISQNGYLAGPMTSVGGRAYVKGAWTVTQVRASVGYPAQHQSVIVDVNKNGTTLFSTQANRPTITTTNYTSAKTNMDVTALADGDYLTVDIDQADPWPWRYAPTTPVAMGTWTSGAYGNSTYVVASQGGAIYSSSDGISWTSRTSQFSTSVINKVIYAGNQFVAVGASGKISTSSDGATWTARTSNSTVELRDIAHNGTNYVAVGASGNICYSSDGATWTKLATADATALNAVTPVGTDWVAVGAFAKIYTAADSNLGTWTSRTSNGTDTFSAVKTANSLVVVAGAGGEVVTAATSDLTAWTKRSSSTLQNLAAATYYGNRGLVHNGTVWCAAGTSGFLATSADGITWVPVAVGDLKDSGAVFEFVTVTSDNMLVAGGTGILAISRDNGGTWQQLPTPLGVNQTNRWYFEGGTTSVVPTLRTVYAANDPLVAADLVVQVYGTPA